MSPLISESRSGRPRVFDGKETLEAWLDGGSLDLAVEIMTKKGKPISKQGVQYATWRWVIEHPDESLAIWQKYGKFLNGKDDEWKKWIAHKIRTYRRSSTKEFHRCLEINGIKDWYYEQELFNACPVPQQKKT